MGVFFLGVGVGVELGGKHGSKTLSSRQWKGVFVPMSGRDNFKIINRREFDRIIENSFETSPRRIETVESFSNQFEFLLFLFIIFFYFLKY